MRLSPEKEDDELGAESAVMILSCSPMLSNEIDHLCIQDGSYNYPNNQLNSKDTDPGR